MTILKEEIRKARKHHKCDACHWFSQSNYGEQDVTQDEWLVVQACFADKGKILPGTKYLYQSFVYEGRIETFKARLDMDKICRKYDLYPED